MFKDKLKQLRTERGYTQSALASLLGVSCGAVGNWESGKREPDCAMLMRLADTLAVSVDTLLDRESAAFAENYDAADSEYLRSLVSSPALRAILERVKDATPEEMAKAATVLDALLG